MRHKKREFTFNIPDPHPCNDNMCTLQCEGVFELPSDEEYEAMDGNGQSHVRSTVHYQLCWEVGNTYPFGADPLKIKVLALNTIRGLRQEVCKLRDTITAMKANDAGDDEIVCVWPDYTWCLREDLESYLSPPCAMSDDYKEFHIDDKRVRALIGE